MIYIYSRSIKKYIFLGYTFQVDLKMDLKILKLLINMRFLLDEEYFSIYILSPMKSNTLIYIYFIYFRPTFI